MIRPIRTFGNERRRSWCSLLLAFVAASLAMARLAYPAPGGEGGSPFETMRLVLVPDAQELDLAYANASLLAAWVSQEGRGPEAPREVRFALVDRTEARLGDRVLVSDGSERILAGWQVGARIAASPSGRVVVAWAVEGRPGRIRIALSDDGGRSFARPQERPSSGRWPQSFPDVAVRQDGAVAIVWLDAVDRMPTGFHRWNLFGSLAPPNGSLGEAHRLDVALDHGICDCCRPTVVASGEGSFLLAYRDDDDRRRSVLFQTLLPSSDRPGSPRRLGATDWWSDACPNDAPVVSSSETGTVALAWREGHGAESSVRLRISDDGGRSFDDELVCAMPEGWRVSHPAVAVAADGSIWVAFEESSREGQRIALHRVSPEGSEVERVGTTADLPEDSRPSGEGLLPSLAIANEETPALSWIVQRRRAKNGWIGLTPMNAGVDPAEERDSRDDGESPR